jgi:hypothetical protein
MGENGSRKKKRRRMILQDDDDYDEDAGLLRLLLPESPEKWHKKRAILQARTAQENPVLPPSAQMVKQSRLNDTKNHERILEFDPEEKARLVTYSGKQKHG